MRRRKRWKESEEERNPSQWEEVKNLSRNVLNTLTHITSL